MKSENIKKLIVEGTMEDKYLAVEILKNKGIRFIRKFFKEYGSPVGYESTHPYSIISYSTDEHGFSEIVHITKNKTIYFHFYSDALFYVMRPKNTK